MKMLYENIPGSGFDPVNNPVKPGNYDDDIWKRKGILVEFD